MLNNTVNTIQIHLVNDWFDLLFLYCASFLTVSTNPLIIRKTGNIFIK